VRIIVSLLLAALSTQLHARANYSIDQDPTVALRSLGAIKIEPFSDKEFIQRLKDAGAGRTDAYAKAAPQANAQVQAALVQGLANYNSSLKPKGLSLHAELLEYRTGDAATRAKATGFGFGMGAGTVGSGFLRYRVTLHQGKTVVAEYRVTAEIKADKQRGYRAAAAFMRDFIEDHAN
jgi:hypothetical protein